MLGQRRLHTAPLEGCGARWLNAGLGVTLPRVQIPALPTASVASLDVSFFIVGLFMGLNEKIHVKTQYNTCHLNVSDYSPTNPTDRSSLGVCKSRVSFIWLDADTERRITYFTGFPSSLVSVALV